jgi:predicted transglutaminase-like cysteine proteinase
VSDEVTDMAIYGLQDPQAQIMLASDEDTGAGLLIGNPVPDAPSLVYAKQTEEYAVFAVSTNALRLLQVNVDSLRERRLLPLTAARIEQVSIEKVGAEKLAMGVNEQGIWEVSAPHRWEIDPVKLALFFNIWQSAKVDRFVVLNEGEPDPRGERVATVSFAGATADGQCVLTLYAPKKAGDLALCRREGEDVLFAFNPELLQMVDLSALDFKNRNILSLLPDQVGKITQVCGTNTVVLARNDSAEFVEPLDELWTVLANLNAVKYVAENPKSLEMYGLDTPACRLTLALTNEGEIGKVLLLGSEYQDGRYAMLQGSDIVFIMGADDADKLCGTLTDKRVEMDNEKK